MNPGPKVSFITAGGAGMYCGSCMRDNTLVRNLSALGWDIELVPAYTPIRTDEANVSVDRVFFSGISMYLQQKIPLFRHLPGWLDKWLDHPAVIKRLTAKSTMKVNGKFLGQLALATVEGDSGVLRKEHRKFVEWLATESRPQLVNLTNLLIGGCIPLIREKLPGVPILVTLQGDDLFLDQLEEPWRGKVIARLRTLAKQVDGFVTFSRYYADAMGRELQVGPEKFLLTPLGIQAEEFEHLSREPGPLTVGYFARICPEKGFHHAVDAFIALNRHPGMSEVRFRAGGWLGNDHREFYDAQIAKLEAAGLMDRFDFIGSPDRAGKLAFFRQVDVFSVPTQYQEPKGIYALEAMASNVAVVQPAHGAFPELLAHGTAGRLVPPGDAEALAFAWQELLTDEPARKALAEAGKRHVLSHARAHQMAAGTAAVYSEILALRQA